MRSILVVLAIILCSCIRVFAFAEDDTITIVAKDEEKQVVPDATVLAGWTVIGSGGKHGSVSVKTNEVGTATLRVGGIPEILVTKDGYYQNGLSRMVDTPGLFPNPVFGLNDPRVDIVLHRRLHPVPMVVRKIEARIPRQGEAVGYDLFIGDWVKPYGNGELSDLIIKMSLSYRANRDYDYFCRISFSNQDDGILLYPERFRFRMNEFRLPREAPNDGYKSDLEWNVIIGNGQPVFADRSKPTRSGPKRELENDNYIFRVRSKRDNSHVDISAMYGKIHGAIVPGIRPFYAEKPGDCYPVISFLYYLNPDGTKNLEWDMEHNLASQKDVPKEP